MNALSTYISSNKLNEVAVMNQLQNHGIISDECITAKEVGDAEKAVNWLKTQDEDAHRSH